MLIENVLAKVTVHILLSMWSFFLISEALTTTEALFSGPKPLKDLNVTKRKVRVEAW